MLVFCTEEWMHMKSSLFCSIIKTFPFKFFQIPPLFELRRRGTKWWNHSFKTYVHCCRLEEGYKGMFKCWQFGVNVLLINVMALQEPEWGWISSFYSIILVQNTCNHVWVNWWSGKIFCLGERAKRTWGKNNMGQKEHGAKRTEPK